MRWLAEQIGGAVVSTLVGLGIAAALVILGVSAGADVPVWEAPQEIADGFGTLVEAAEKYLREP